MRRSGETGMTLVELIISITIMGIIAGGATALLSICLDAHAYGSNKSALHREGLLAMDRMTAAVRNTTNLLIPNGHNPTRDILAVSALINDDNDFYFDDPLFPRIDEDVSFDMNDDGDTGIDGFDDDGDGSVDEGFHNDSDDDEDGLFDEDPLDGMDNDGDGMIDEDCGGDATDDGASGIAGMDDDADGLVDEDSRYDDDEDGSLGEVGLIPVIYRFHSAQNQLKVSIPYLGQSIILSEHATVFKVDYEAQDANHDPRVLVSLTMTGDDGESIVFSEYVYPRNILQKTGKKVR